MEKGLMYLFWWTEWLWHHIFYNSQITKHVWPLRSRSMSGSIYDQPVVSLNWIEFSSIAPLMDTLNAPTDCESSGKFAFAFIGLWLFDNTILSFGLIPFVNEFICWISCFLQHSYLENYYELCIAVVSHTNYARSCALFLKLRLKSKEYSLFKLSHTS